MDKANTPADLKNAIPMNPQFMDYSGKDEDRINIYRHEDFSRLDQ